MGYGDLEYGLGYYKYEEYPPFSLITVDFTSNVVSGYVPLTVRFTANVTLHESIINTHKVIEYRWYFDHVNSPSTYTSTTDIVISHTFSGNYNNKFAIRLEPIVGLI